MIRRIQQIQKGGEMWTRVTSDTMGGDFVKPPTRRKRSGWREIQRREKSRPNVVTWPPLYETPAWLYCHLSALSRAAPPFLYCQTVASLPSLFLHDVKLHFSKQTSDKDGKIKTLQTSGEAGDGDYGVNCVSQCENNCGRAFDNCQSNRW